MSDPLSRLPRWQADRMTLLLDALGDIALSYPERASLAWIAGQDFVTVENLAAVIRRAITTAASSAERSAHRKEQLP